MTTVWEHLINLYPGKKAYNDMNSEEKELVKEFSGDEIAYNKIYNNQTAYLIDKNELLQITG